MTFYTVEVYKKDRRRNDGERLIKKQDLSDPTGGIGICDLYDETYPKEEGYRIEVHKTYVTRKNLMTGQEFQERYDTPYFCSPSSETYWSS